MINESNLVNVPRSMLSDIFKYVKLKFLTISYKYSIKYQKAVNIHEKRNPDYGIKQIKNEFTKLGLTKLENSSFKKFSFSYHIFPINYQKRLKDISPFELLITFFTKLRPNGYYIDGNIGIKLDSIYRISYNNNKIRVGITNRTFDLKNLNSYTINLFDNDKLGTYFKKLTEVIEHELTHFINELLIDHKKENNIKKIPVNNDKQFGNKNSEEYFTSNSEYKTQILTTYRGLIKYYNTHKISYDNLDSTFKNLGANLFLPPWSVFLVFNAIYPKKIYKIIKTILNTLYKYKRLEKTKKEKIFIKKYIKSLLYYYKSMKKDLQRKKR